MTKELEAFYCILNNDYDSDERYKLAVNNVEDGLKRLEVIENANPSEALECLEEMWELSCDSRKPEYILYETIKQTLIKAQKQEKEIAYIEKIKTMMKQKEVTTNAINAKKNKI